MITVLLKRNFKQFCLATLFTAIATSAFAEEAPVFDVDNYSPQFDEQSEQPLRSAPRRQSEGESQMESSGSAGVSDASHLSVSQRLNRLEQQLNNASRTDSGMRIEDMQNAIQALRGQVDELSHQLQQLEKQQKSLYSDLDKRLSTKGVSSTAAPIKSNATSERDDVDNGDVGDVNASRDAEDNNTTPSQPISAKQASKKPGSPAVATKAKADKSMDSTAAEPNPAEEQKAYQAAYNLIKAKKYHEATITLQKMLQKYPSGQFASNAHYWLGELYGLLGKNEESATEFNTVIKNYPDNPKVADSQLKLGLIYAADLKWTEAKGAFKKIISKYPGTGSARLAAEQLKQIKQAGH